MNDPVQKFRDAIKTLVQHNEFVAIADLLPVLLGNHPRYNDAMEFSRKIDEQLSTLNRLTSTREELKVERADLSRSIMEFVDRLEFEPGWEAGFDWERLNTQVDLALDRKPPPAIDENERYTCDRSEAVDGFRVHFNRQRRLQKKQFYFILGEEWESPYGLYRRLGLREIPALVSPSQRPLPPIRLGAERKDIEASRLSLKIELFSQLQIRVNQLDKDLEQMRFRDLIELSPSVKAEEAVVVGFEKQLGDWTRASAGLLHWFINDFCRGESYGQDPVFVFFFKIVFPAPKKRWAAWRQRRAIRRCMRELARIPNAVILDRLGPVPRSDVNNWIAEKLGQRDYIERQQLLETRFGNEERFHMSRVEHELEQLIREHNQQRNYH